MLQNFQVDLGEIDKISKINETNKKFRKENLKTFNDTGFPTKKDEDWKFSDLREIISKNFSKLEINHSNPKEDSIRLISSFDHNYILLINGKLIKSDLKFEDKKMVSINNYHDKIFSEKKSQNPLICLNNALSNNGYFIEVKNNYKFEKLLVIYNLFTGDLSNKILNNKNKIILGDNSELHTFEYTINRSKNKFLVNSYENSLLAENSIHKNISIQAGSNNGYFHKYGENILKSNSSYSSFIFSSGPKFLKQDLKFDLIGQNAECNIRSALYLNENDHQEIKTRVNHLVPSCKSFQKIKSVLNSNSKGIYQGKIYVKDVAQKTNAYQLSKALIISENSEFDSKPELEIYADDVKCSHGSTSGNVDENSIHYLMTRGLSKKEAINLLINGFLNEIASEIKSKKIREFVNNKLEYQIHGY